jgi:hypothetical protein
MRVFRILICFALLLGVLAGCGTGQLLSDVGPQLLELQSTGNGEHVDISYTIGQPAKVSVYIEDSAGARYALRENEPRLPSSDPYKLQFDGAVPANQGTLKRKALPTGTYTYTVQATADTGATAQAQGQIAIVGADHQPPLIDNLVVTPATISPNADGIDDVAEITYQLPVTATIDIIFTGPDGNSFPFVAADEEQAGPQKHIWNGKTVDNTLLLDGRYDYVVRAQDEYGNLVEQPGTIAIVGGGLPEVKITYSNITPAAIMKGELITVRMLVKNTGKVPIRTYGPPSGYEYSTDQVFSAIEGGKYVVKPGGFWRIGVDWDANSGGAAKRYPFRWAITPRPPDQWQIPNQEDVLMPGEEAEVIGRIRVDQPETKMSFYVGLIQDGVGFFQDKYGRTIVEVSF